MADTRVNYVDQELFSELTEPLVQPLPIHHVVPPFAEETIQTIVYKSTGTFYGNGGRWRQLEETIWSICSSSKKPDICENETGAPNNCFL